METNKLEITTKYKKSMIVDQFSAVVPVFLIVLIDSQINKVFFNSPPYALILLAIAASVYLLFSDILCFSRSLGKRIYHIMVLNNDSSNRKVCIVSLIYRRILELAIHPFFTKTFQSKADLIDKLTQTHIEMIEKDI